VSWPYNRDAEGRTDIKQCHAIVWLQLLIVRRIQMTYASPYIVDL
jgi:hypothetical protein